MKKRRWLSLMFVPLLLACAAKEGDSSSLSSSSWINDDPLPLEKDTSERYEFADSSNESGSMNYEIFVRSFYDSNADGIGDLNGVKAKLPYLADMGYKTLWLMPIFPSPTYHGYDVTDYYAVNEDYGTLDDLTSLVREAATYNIDIMLDMVFNHCSIQHEYFKTAFNDYINANYSSGSKADWFNFGPGGDHIYNGVYYESRFDANMPDFNLDSAGVRAEIENIVKFWIDKGIKGFRLDAVLYYYYQNTSKNVEFLNWLTEIAHKYDPSFYMVGEVWSSDPIINGYFASECDSFFRFGNAVKGNTNMVNMVKGFTSCEYFAEEVEKNETAIHKKNPSSYSSYFLSNHDQDRISTNLDSNLDVYKAAASLYTLLPGTSYTYYGEEIALKGQRVISPQDDLSDVRRRLPMIWSKEDKTGQCTFPEKNRQDLNNNKQVEIGVEEQKEDGFSLLNHYKMMIHLRNKYPFIKHASFSSRTPDLDTDERSVLAYTLSDGESSITVVHNFHFYNVEVTSPGTKILDEINVSHQKPLLQDGKLRLGAYSSVILS